MNEKFEFLIVQLIEKGYAVLDGFIPEKVVKSLSENLQERFSVGEMKEAGIGRANDFQKKENYRSDVISWLDSDTDDEAERTFLDLIDGRPDAIYQSHLLHFFKNL